MKILIFINKYAPNNVVRTMPRIQASKKLKMMCY